MKTHITTLATTALQDGPPAHTSFTSTAIYLPPHHPSSIPSQRSIMSHFLSDLILISFALTACVLADLPDGPPESMDERFDNLHFLDLNGGLNTLSYPAYTVAQWAFGTVPQACFDMAGDRQCDPHELEVFDVNYDDVNLLVFIRGA